MRDHVVDGMVVSRWRFKFIMWKLRMKPEAYGYMVISGKRIYVKGRTLQINDSGGLNVKRSC